MRLAITLIPVRKIKPSASRWNFSDAAIEQAAHAIAKVEGMINPLVLRRQTGLESYEVLEGNFEYYAAARASELEPDRCGRVAAVIAEPEDEALIREQIQFFRTSRLIPVRSTYSELEFPVDTDTRLVQLEMRQASLESHQLMLEQQEIQLIKQQLVELKQQVHKRTDLLQLFNQGSREDLLQQMKQVGLIGKTAEKIVESIETERQYKPFIALKEVVVRVKGLTYEKMVDLVE